jgi:hypothetical protein
MLCTAMALVIDTGLTDVFQGRARLFARADTCFRVCNMYRGLGPVAKRDCRCTLEQWKRCIVTLQ